ncbi:MAG: sugar transferase [Acidobacteria bacterium]|nr:sugar transferase [Acidobacteriota bacterium]
MFREHARLFITLQISADLVLSALAFPLAYWSRLHLEPVLPQGWRYLLNPELHPMTHYLWLAGAAVAWWAVVAVSLGLYKVSMRRSDWTKIRIVLESGVLMGLFLGSLSFALKLDLSRPLIALFVSYQAALLLAARAVVRLQSMRSVRSPRNLRNILIVGSGVKALEMGDLLSRYAEWGFRILGYVDVNGTSRVDSQVGARGTIADIPRIIEEEVVDEIIFVGSKPVDLNQFDDVLAVCKEQGIRTRVALDIFPAKVSKVSMEFLEGIPLVTFNTTPDRALAHFIKRVTDLVLGSALLLALLPSMALIGLLVRLTSRGPAIYRQLRCGLYGRKFVLYKFRSMQKGAEDVLWEIKHLNEMGGPVFKMRNDPRVTPLGRFLRRSSIDELPQLWNVLKGDLSLVGPRAPLPEEVREYTRWQRRRLSVRPGITCLWQVSGRNEVDFNEWMKLDLHYIDNWSLLLDLKILLRTFPVVLLGKGAR